VLLILNFHKFAILAILIFIRACLALNFSPFYKMMILIKLTHTSHHYISISYHQIINKKKNLKQHYTKYLLNENKKPKSKLYNGILVSKPQNPQILCRFVWFQFWYLEVLLFFDFDFGVQLFDINLEMKTASGNAEREVGKSNSSNMHEDFKQICLKLVFFITFNDFLSLFFFFSTW
jgi:hypothetical protein